MLMIKPLFSFHSLPIYDTKLNLIREYGVPFHYSYSLSPGVVVPVRVPSMGQIELFNLLLGIIINIK